MTWEEIKKRIQDEIQPEGPGILKCRGNNRRPVISNDGSIIKVDAGVKTKQSKTITYEMLEYAYRKISSGKEFSSEYFRERYENEHINGPCIYSATGGILVELGIAEREPFKGNSCIYRKSQKTL